MKLLICACAILFITVVVMVCMYKGNKNEISRKIINVGKSHPKTGVIPKIIHATYHAKHKIPQHVKDKLINNHKNYKIIIYDDDDCRRELSKLGPEYVDKFNSLVRGAHKADFFRYCILYLHGGIYLDIKTDLVMSKLLEW